MPISRRNLLKAGGIGTGAVLVGGGIAKLLLRGDIPSFLQQPAGRGEAWHLLNRLAFGASPGQVAAVSAMTPASFIEQQLHPESLDDHTMDAMLATYATLRITPAQLYALKDGDQVAFDDLNSATILRAIYSRRQLYEVLVLFWSEHFSIWHGKDNCPYLKTFDDRDAIRPHALGHFRDLLGASVHSPAMLDYLDNSGSDKDHPNENYARELLELHTLSPSHYTERDVKEFARCLTGWTYVQDESDPHLGEFFFDATIHDDDEKVVLGHTIHAGGGQQDVETVLDLIVAQPACAQFISKKLCRRFVADEPPSSVVDAAAATFHQTHGDIRAVVRTILTAPEFLHAPPKFRRPFEYLIGLARGFAVNIVPGKGGPQDIFAGLSFLDHAPFEHHQPDGYKDIGDHWRSNLLTRWNIALTFTYGNVADSTIDPIATAQAQGATTAEHILAYYASQLLGRDISHQENDTLWGFVTKNGTPDLTTDDGKATLLDAIALIAISPAAQYR